MPNLRFYLFWAIMIVAHFSLIGLTYHEFGGGAAYGMFMGMSCAGITCYFIGYGEGSYQKEKELKS